MESFVITTCFISSGLSQSCGIGIGRDGDSDACGGEYVVT
jgi:hypothetical protein